MTKDENRNTAPNTGLAKVAVHCSADTFVDNQTLVLRINIGGQNATFAKPTNVSGQAVTTVPTKNGEAENRTE